MKRKTLPFEVFAGIDRDNCSRLISLAIKISCLLFSSVLFSGNITAQKILAEIALKTRSPEYLGVFPTSQKIFFSYSTFDSKSTDVIPHYVLIDSTGATEIPNIPFLNKRFIDVTFTDGKYAFYYFEKINHQVNLKALLIDGVTNAYQISPKEFPVDDKLIGVCKKEEKFILVSYNRTENSMVRTVFQNMNILKETKHILPVDLSQYYDKRKPMALIPSSGILNKHRPQGPVKVFIQDDDLWITIDSQVLTTLPSNKLQSTIKTQVMHLKDSITDVPVWEIEEKKPGQLSSFICKNMLFRIVNWQSNISIKSYDLNSRKETGACKILADSSSKTKFIWERLGDDYDIKDDIRLYGFIKSSADWSPSVFVLPLDSGLFRICWGSYYNSNDSMGTFGNHPDLLENFLSFLISAAWRQTQSGPDISRYFYLDWNSQDLHFNLSASENKTLNEKIDAYELELKQNKFKAKFIDHFNYGKSIIGIYLPKGSDSLRFIEFK